jgi:hypothetical protein
LAVGNNGESLVADSSTSTGLRYQSAYNGNVIINGGYDVWQRGTTGTANGASAGTGYNADRWANYASGTAITVSRQATGDTTNLPFIQYCARVQRNSGQTSLSKVHHAYSMETTDAIRFSGQTVTFSFYARKGSNFSATSDLLAVEVYSGTGTDQNIFGYTGANAFINSSATLTTTWQRFTFTGTVSASSTEIGVLMGFTPTGTASTNDFFEITGVQLELGSRATTFKRSNGAGGTLQGELAACQRYYYRQTSSQLYSIFASAIAENGTTAYTYTAFPVTMRVAPTSIDYSTVGIGNSFNLLTAVTPALQTNTQSPYAGAVKCTGGSGLTAGSAYYLTANNSATAYLAFNAEL